MKRDLVIKSMREDWLLEITIDENGLLHVKDLATEEDWYQEMITAKEKRIREAFGEGG